MANNIYDEFAGADLFQNLQGSSLLPELKSPIADKTNLLAERKKEKLDLLGSVAREKFYDADTAVVDGQKYRVGDPTGAYPQAFEKPSTLDWQYEEGRRQEPATPEDYAKYDASMRVLDNYMAGVVPASEEAIQKSIDEPLTPKNKALYDQYIQKTEMIPLEAKGIEGHEDKYGRQVSSMQSPLQEDTLQERLVKTNVADERQGTAAPGYGAGQDTRLYPGAAPLDTDGMIGESIDIAQSSLVQQWGKLGKAATNIGRWVGEELGVDKDTMEAIFLDRSGLFDQKFTELAKQEVADKMTGVLAKTREEQAAGMDAALKNVEKGDYGKAAWETFKIVPYMLGDSAGEMASIMAGAPGITLAVAARVNEDAEEYEKNNGKKPDTEWLLGSTLTNAAALFGERFLLKSGIAGIIEKGVSKAKRTGGVALSAIGEATQEYYDQVQQEYMTQKEGDQTLGEIATSPEAQLGAIAGGVMGGALRGTGETTRIAIDKAKPTAERIQAEMDRRKAAKETEAEVETADIDVDTPIDVTNVDQAIAKASEVAVARNTKDDTKAKARVDEVVQKVIDDADIEETTFGSSEKALDAIEFVFENSTKTEKGKTKVDPELVTKLNRVAKKYGISDEKFNAVSKNYIDVEQDAVEGRRGYNTQRRKLETLLVDPETNSGKINKTLGQMQGFLDAQIEYEQGLESVINDAEAKLKTNQRAAAKNAPVDNSPIKFTLEKSPNRKKEHTVFAVPTKQGIEQAKMLLETKRRNIEELEAGIRTAHGKVEGAGVKIADKTVATKITVPAGKKIDESTFKKHGVTKVILGKAYPKRWNEYKKIGANEPFINAKEYTKDDVVVVSVKDTDSIGKAASSQIKAARKAGATIVLDKMPQKTKAALIHTYLKPETSDKVKGPQYVPVKGKKGVFKSKEVAEVENKKYEEIVAKEKEEADTEAKIKEDMIRTYVKLRSASAENIMKHKDLKDHIENMKPYFKSTETKSSEEKIESYLDGVWNKQVEKLAKDYAGAMHKNEGVLSPEARNELAKQNEATMKEMKVAAEKIAGTIEAERESGIDILEIWNKFADKHQEIKGTEKYYDTLFDALEKFKLKRSEVVNEIVTETSSSLDHSAKNGTVYVLPSKRDTKGVETKARVSEKYKEGYRQVIVHTNKYIDASKTKPTVFNTLPVDYMGDGIDQFGVEAVEGIKESIQTEGLKKSPDRSKYSEYEFALQNSPSRGLLLDKEGNINKNVATVLRLALYEYINTNGSMLSTAPKTQEGVMAAHGLEQHQVNRKVRQALGDKGMLRKSMANDIGKTIKQHLGLVAKSEVDKEQMDRLYADLANTSVLMGVAEGILELDEMNLNAYNKLLGIEGSTKGDQGADVGFVRIAKEKFVDPKEGTSPVSDIRTTYELIEDTLPEVSTMRREPHTRPISKNRVAKIKAEIRKDKSGFKPAKEAQEALNGLMKQSWKINEGMAKWVTDNVEGRRELLMKALGYKDLTNENVTNEMTFEERDSQEAQNRDIEKSIEELERLMERIDKEEGGNYDKARLFFEWVYVKNGRYMMDSNTINPQTDKQLHRFIVTPEEHEIGYRIQKDENGNTQFIFDKWTGQRNKEVREQTEQELEDADVSRQMFYGLAQGLGIAVDKKSSEKFIGEMQTLVNAVADKTGIKIGKDIAKIDDIRNQLLDKGELELTVGETKIEIEIEHVAHALQALDVLENIEKGNKKFNSSITAEFDAVTSGFGIKLTQMPIIKNIVRYALKVGILPKVLATDEGKKFYEQDKTFEKDHKALIEEMNKPGFDPSMNDILDGFIKDSYQTLATKIVDLDFDSSFDKQQEKGATKIPNFKSYSYAFEEKEAKAIWSSLEKKLPKFTEETGVTSDLRNLFKNPFMVFNYSAAIKTIRASLASNMAADVVSKILSDDELTKSILKNTVGLDTKSVDQLRKEIRTKSADEIYLGGKKTLQGYLETMINMTYGAKVEEVLTEEFGPFLEVQESINLAFRAMFMAYNVELKERVNALIEDKGFITKSEERQIINDLKEKFPAIKGPLADGEQIQEEGMVGIYSTKTGDPEGSVAAQTLVNPKLIKGQKTLKIWHRLKEFDAAVSAGSVVPIHYLDGALMADVLNEMSDMYGTSGVTAIHDAIMPPLITMNESTKRYNKSLVDRTRKYNVVEEITKSMKRIQEGVAKDKQKFSDKEKILIDGEEAEKSISDIVDMATKGIEDKYNDVQKGLETFHSMLDEEGAYIMHMAGMAEGVYEYSKDGDQISSLRERAIASMMKTGAYKTKDEALAAILAVQKARKEEGC